MGEFDSFLQNASPAWGAFRDVLERPFTEGFNLVWMIALILAAAFLVFGLALLSKAKSGRRSDDIVDARDRIGWALVGLAALVAITTIIRTAFTLIG